MNVLRILKTIIKHLLVNIFQIVCEYLVEKIGFIL